MVPELDGDVDIFLIVGDIKGGSPGGVVDIESVFPEGAFKFYGVDKDFCVEVEIILQGCELCLWVYDVADFF